MVTVFHACKIGQQSLFDIKINLIVRVECFSRWGRI